MTLGWRAAGATAVLLSAFVLAVPAGAAARCALSVRPAQVERDLPARAFADDIVYENRGGATCEVSLAVRALAHDVDGTPRYPASDIATRAFRLEAGSFRLAARARRVVHLSGTIPSDQKSAYVGVLALYSNVGERTATSIETRTQIASQFLLRAPKPWIERIAVIDVGLLQGDDGRHVYATVRNTGNVHTRPTGTVEIRDRRGRLLGRVRLEPERADNPPAVLPGLARRLSGAWDDDRPLEESITLIARVEGITRRATVDFVAGKPLLPAAELRLNVAARDGGIVAARVASTGTALLHGAHVVLTATQDGRFERAREVFSVVDLRPGSGQDIRWAPGLGAGSYTITARAELGTRVLDEVVAGLQLGAAGEGATPRRRAFPLAVAAALAAAAGIALLGAIGRARGFPFTRTGAR